MTKLHNCLLNVRFISKYVPKHNPTIDNDVKTLTNFITKAKKLFILTGAGVSTESGIPDYRSELVGLYARTNHKPVQIREFLNSSDVRQRYWARNYVGWPKFAATEPNSAHFFIASLENNSCVVTQNVDRLHAKAGSKNLIELHGSSYRVNCLNCEAKTN